VPTAFVLSGAGSLGSVHVGMLQALFERRITPDLLVGASAGAINAAYLAGRPPTTGTVAELGAFWRSMRSSRVFSTSPASALVGILGERPTFAPPGPLGGLVSRLLGIERLEEASTPLHVVGVDALTGDDRLLSQGSALEAVMASSALPAVFPPVAWQGRWLVDGGMAGRTPIWTALALGADRLIVLPAGLACALPAPPRGAVATAVHALSVQMQQRLVGDLERARADGRVMVIPPPCPVDVDPTDFGHADALIARAHRAAEAFLDEDAGAAGDGDPAPGLTLHHHAAPAAA
jgi:NTE family protein